MLECFNSEYYGISSYLDSAKIVVDLYKRRKLLEFAKDLQEKIARQDSLIDISADLILHGEGLIEESQLNEFETGEQVYTQIMEDLKTQIKPVSSGLDKLDICLGGGFFSGKAYGFAARKKVGKTILAGTLSYNLAQNGVKHLFVCGEMSPKEIHQRILCRAGKFYPSAYVDSYNLSDDFSKKIYDASRWNQQNVIYRNAPALTFEKFKRLVILAIKQKGIKGFILDYWQLVGGKDSRKSTAEHLEEVAQWIADTCRKYNVFAITFAQINQEGNTRGGEGLRLAFDQVYQIHKEDPTVPECWLEMMDTRYTKWQNIGEKDRPGLRISEYMYFEEI